MLYTLPLPNSTLPHMTQPFLVPMPLIGRQPLLMNLNPLFITKPGRSLNCLPTASLLPANDKTKLDAFGNVQRYKARLVARGFSQVPGIDYTETYSPVVKLPTIRLLLALFAIHNLELHQLDVKTAFLHGTLQEQIYMTLPPGLLSPTQEATLQAKYKHPLALILFQAIYGLKQSARLWYQKFDSFLLKIGFTRSTADSNLYIYHSGAHFVYLALYVDDCILVI